MDFCQRRFSFGFLVRERVIAVVVVAAELQDDEAIRRVCFGDFRGLVNLRSRSWLAFPPGSDRIECALPTSGVTAAFILFSSEPLDKFVLNRREFYHYHIVHELALLQV